MIQSLTYELSILAQAVQHKNLSAASVHVGISQPQLSRMIAKIEAELNVILLDRSARRKSGWTPVAQQLATVYAKGIGRLQNEILSLAQEIELNDLRVGTLEGLSSIAEQFAQSCFEKLEMHMVHLDVLDFKDLDSQFLSGDLDLIFTVRAPSKQKFQHQIEVGYQQIEKISTDKGVHVLSPFEYAGLDKKDLDPAKKWLVSNSLAVRSHWLHEIGGTGNLPINATKGRGKGYYSIYMIGSEVMSPKLWTNLTTLIS